MITWCEKCHVKPISNHRAKCDFCSKGSHAVCEDCFHEGIEDGSVKAIQQKKGILTRIFG